MTPKNDEAILNFWRAYLVRAIRDLDEWFYAEGAKAYVLDDDERVLGFRWVCSVLGKDADKARRLIMDAAIRRRCDHGNRRHKRAA